MARWPEVELAGGALAAIVGMAVAVTMLALGAHFWAVGLAGLSAVGAGTGAYMHAVRRKGEWPTVLWVSSLGLVVMTVLGVFSIGVFLLPRTLAALVAAGIETWRSTAGA